jgi:6-pyruvoyl-tetrahydropterin synthase|tara:strand:- start:1066 stop:1473 length:408 start_codon:yes stop_codon:yes gene_type:complete
MFIEKKYYFYAGHRNKKAGEKCGRLHGHTYDIKCTFKFGEMKDGVTMLFSDIDNKVEPIIKSYDHYLILHDKDPLVDVLTVCNEEFLVVPFETSAENMAIWLFNRIQNEAKMPIVKIELAETKSSTVIYEPKVSN